MRDAWLTTFLSKDGRPFGSGKPHFMGEEGARNTPAIRRGIGFCRDLRVKFVYTSPTKRDIIAMYVMVREE